MQGYLKYVIIFCILAPRWTVSIQLKDSIQKTIEENEKKIQKLQAEIYDNEKYLNFDEAINSTKVYISSLEDKLKQCEEQNRNQSESQLSHIISAIQEIKSNTDTNKNEFKQNDDHIKSLNAQIEDKKSLLKDYQRQIKEKALEIEKLKKTLSAYNNTINNNNAQISNLQSIIGSQNNTIVKNSAQILMLQSNTTFCKETVNKKNDEISRLKTNLESKNSAINKNNADISKLESTVKNNNETIANLESTIKYFNSTINNNNAEISKLKSEKINPRATTPQPRTTCPSYNNKSQQEITQLKSEANKQTNEIKELKIQLNKSLSNNTNFANSRDENFKKYQNAQISLESCQRNLESLKNWILRAEIMEQERKLIQQQLNLCQDDLKIQKADCFNKDSTIRDWQKKAADNQKAEEERNSLQLELSKCQLNIKKISTEKDAGINKLRKEAMDNYQRLGQCQIEVNSTQDNLDSCRNSYEYFYNRSKSLQTNLTNSQHELSKCISLKDAIIKKLNSKEDELNECKSQSTTPSRSLPTSCKGLNAGFQNIQLSNGNSLNVLCDNDGWIIVQRRMNGKLDFNRNWKEYVNGFEDQSRQGEFFIGLENLYLITNSRRHEVYISVTVSRSTLRTKYDNFRVGNAESLYELESIGNHDGDYNGLFWNENQKFSTYDRNNRDYCSANGMGGWWYPKNCGYTNLNAPYGYLRWSSNTASNSIIRIRPYEQV